MWRRVLAASILMFGALFAAAPQASAGPIVEYARCTDTLGPAQVVRICMRIQYEDLGDGRVTLRQVSFYDLNEGGAGGGYTGYKVKNANVECVQTWWAQSTEHQEPVGGQWVVNPADKTCWKRNVYFNGTGVYIWSLNSDPQGYFGDVTNYLP